jgi:glycosyltransferase involved in cell wall biosynthesis
MKSLLFIDPHFVKRSPSLKSTLREFPACFDDFDQVEVWAIESDFEHPKLKIDPVYCPFQAWHLVSLWYWFAIHLRYFWRFIVLRQKRPTVVQSTNYYCYWADLIYFHFSFLGYARVISQHRDVFRLSFARRLVFIMHYVQEWILFHVASPKWWWVVSRRLMEESRELAITSSNFRVLPNGYDGQRFNQQVRQNHRASMREKLGFNEVEIVFIFVSLGDLERKGFCLAAQAVDLLVRRGLPARLLFVGGPSQEAMDMSEYLRPYGIQDLRFLHSLGRVPDIERYMSAADALLFPSYCEAFALVEIEAAALGLRLYLTPHYGSEMILNDNENGRFLPWNAQEISQILEQEIRSGVVILPVSNMGEALSREEFLQALRKRYQEILLYVGKES